MMALSPELLLNAYVQGVFPMGEENEIYWYAPDPRAILPLDDFHVPARLARTVRQVPYEIRIDGDFRATITACAETRSETWITPAILDIYVQLHHLGFAHSVEAWREGELVGGLYGVSINSFFAGESMFSTARDASKVALVHLVERLRNRHYQLLDVQFQTPHLARFGAVEIPRAEYLQRLDRALRAPNHFV